MLIFRNALLAPTIALSLIGCGIEIPEEFQYAPLSTEEESNDSNDLFQLSDDEYSGETEISESHQLIINNLKGLQLSAKQMIADCAGFGTEAAAFVEKKQSLLDQGLSREEIHSQMKEDHLALKEVMKPLRDSIKSCKEENKDSELISNIRSVVDACWDKPEGDENGFSLRKGKRGKRGKKGMKGPHGSKGKMKLPPKEFANFDSQECIDASAAVFGTDVESDDVESDEVESEDVESDEVESEDVESE